MEAAVAAVKFTLSLDVLALGRELWVAAAADRRALPSSPAPVVAHVQDRAVDVRSQLWREMDLVLC